MWHASAAARPGSPTGAALLRHYARAALEGVGDVAAGEWEEMGVIAFHVRRRLTEAEQRRVGPVMDIRGTDEAEQRLARVRAWLPAGYVEGE